MLILFFLVGLIGGILWIRANHDSVGAIGLIVICGLGVAVSTLVLPLNRMDTYAEIKQYEALEATVTAARDNDTGIETAALQLQIIKANQWLASVKYWRSKRVFSIYWPAEIDALQPIE